MDKAQQAADQGKWWHFIQLIGGVTAKRNDNPIKFMKIDSKERGKYGDPIGKKICGVETETIQLPTRLHQWLITKNLVETTSTDRRSAMHSPICHKIQFDHEQLIKPLPILRG